MFPQSPNIAFNSQGQCVVHNNLDDFLEEINEHAKEHIDAYKYQIKQFHNLRKWLDGKPCNIDFNEIILSKDTFIHLLSCPKIDIGFLDIRVCNWQNQFLDTQDKLSLILANVEYIHMDTLRQLLCKSKSLDGNMQTLMDNYVIASSGLTRVINFIDSMVPANIKELNIFRNTDLENALRDKYNDKSTREMVEEFADILECNGIDLANQYLSGLKNKKEELINRYCVLFEFIVSNKTNNALIQLSLKVHYPEEIVKRIGYLFSRERLLLNSNIDLSKKKCEYLQNCQNNQKQIEIAVNTYINLLKDQLNKYLISDITQLILKYLL